MEPRLVECDRTSVAELVAQYVAFATEHFRRNSDERYRIKAAITPLVELYGSLPVDEFSPKKLKAVRQQLIDRRNAHTGKPLCRKYVNQLTALIKKIFKWGVSEELAPVSVFQALDTLPGLRKGRTVDAPAARLSGCKLQTVGATSARSGMSFLRTEPQFGICYTHFVAGITQILFPIEQGDSSPTDQLLPPHFARWI